MSETRRREDKHPGATISPPLCYLGRTALRKVDAIASAWGCLGFGFGEQQPEPSATEDECQPEGDGQLRGGPGRLRASDSDDQQEGGEKSENSTDEFFNKQHLWGLLRQEGECRKLNCTQFDTETNIARQDAIVAEIRWLGLSLLKMTVVRILRAGLAGECLSEVVDEVFWMFQSDGDADGFFGDSRCCAGFGGHGSVAHGGWEGDQAFDSTEGFGDVEEFGIHADAFGDGSAVADVEGQHCSEAFLLLAGELMLGVGFEAGIVDAFDERVLFEEAGDAKSGGLLGIHAAAECFDAAEDEPGIEG
jgi:hypothetical protein